MENRKTLIVILIILSFGIFGFMQSDNELNFFSLEFNLVNKTANLSDYDLKDGQFCARARFINMNHPTIEMIPYLEFSNKTQIYAFYIEAYDLNNTEVDLNTFTHPDYFPVEMKKFSKGDIINQTICSDHLYKFNDRGVYKLRLVFDPKKYFRHSGEIKSEIVYSNWDTITIN